MGQAVIRLTLQDSDVKLQRAFEYSGHGSIGKDISKAVDDVDGDKIVIEEIGKDVFKDIDVLIDFTTPGASLKHVEYASGQRRGIVIGTTGFKPDEVKIIENASKQTAVFLSPNMSLGANLLFKLAYDTAKRLDDKYDIEIVEAHHNKKKDAPSGTAIRLAESICEAKNWKLDEVVNYSRKGITGERPSKEIGIHSIRSGDIIGWHTVLFAGQSESIELVHRAGSRDAFAKGSIIAAKFIADKKKGMFGMHDLLKEL
jgi:4-hydroxy-tetrahydrodipicolinate reductase